jgi:protein phosphatase
MELKIGQCSLQGPYREDNQDAVHVELTPNMTACLVADGCGTWGLEDGANPCDSVARRTVTLLASILGNQLLEPRNNEECSDIIRKALASVNTAVCDRGARTGRDGGSTIVLAVWQRTDVLQVAGIGDSRAYRVRDSVLEQLTVDDTVAQALIKHGTMTVAESLQSQWRYVLWKYLGSKEVGDGPEVKCVPLQPADRFLLCTDGLTHPVPEGSLLSCIQEHPDPQRCAEALCQLALERGSRDNVSCIVLAVI